jgi:signal transduction histidine kinase
VVRAQLENLEMLIDDAGLKVELVSTGSPQIKMNASLAHTLIQNLLKNAIRHNVPDGHIHIRIETSSLQISNSGRVVSFDPEKMFGRFKKNSQHPQSLGIGLSIVKRICDISAISVSYEQKDTEHIFRLSF